MVTATIYFNNKTISSTSRPTETYFDGLGRTIKTRAEGPDNKVITTRREKEGERKRDVDAYIAKILTKAEGINI